MNDKHLEMLNDVNVKQEEVTHMLVDYWNLYSHMGTWQFWIVATFLFVLPLAVLYFTIDREKIFLIGFYGFSINVWLNFASNIGNNLGWWDYIYMISPHLPGFSINAALLPVVFMLVYQWTLNHKKNFYLFSLLTAVIYSLIFLPLLVNVGFFKLNKELNYFHVLLIYIAVFMFSKLIVSIFLYMKNNKKKKLPG